MFAMHRPNCIQDFGTFGYLVLGYEYPMVAFFMPFDFMFHCFDELGTIRCLHGFVKVQNVWVTGGSISDGFC